MISLIEDTAITQGSQNSAHHSEGFVLISALWLLILGGGIAALLMLRSIDAARDARAASESAETLDIPDDAIATVASDILFQGPNGTWARLPSAGSLKIGGRVVRVALGREDILPDVNKSDIPTLDDALREHGYDPRQRDTILSRVSDIRASNGEIASFASVAALARSAVPSGRENCLADVLSPFGGTGAPVEGAARALQDTGVLFRIGDVVRFTISGLGSDLSYAVRITNATEQPYSVIDWQDKSCAPGAGRTATA